MPNLHATRPVLLPTGRLGLLAILILLCLTGVSHSAPAAPEVLAPPESFFQIVRERDRDAARQFYRKFIDVNGLPVVAAGVVEDLALQRTYDIVTHLLAGRPDILRAMGENEMYLIIIGKDQVYTDMPEYRNHPNPDYQNERVRGTGGRPTSFGEENLLSLPLDRYDDESIGVHEFCHTIDGTLRSIDPTWRDRKEAAFNNAREKGLYVGAYAGTNPGEYWAEICQSYFDCNRVNNYNHGPVATREQLKIYDPVGYELVRATFNLKPDQDWRYTFVRPLPNVTAPPARFKIHPYYTKFTWAREFTVLGRDASDAALLKANDTLRKLFPYRHDLLKALIAEDARLVVLGKNERISDLPEYGEMPEVDPLARFLTYHPGTKLVVVGEENVLADPAVPGAGDHQVIRVMASAVYRVAGTRPVDPDWENRPRRLWQQYELRLQRLDVRFDQRLQELHTQALAAGKWKGSSAVHDRERYWATGLLAYFDAAGQESAPNDAPHPIRTRELLRDYDGGLYRLVNETMAYEGRVDWRFKP